MSTAIENTDWSKKLLKNGGKLKGSAKYHLQLLQTDSVYDKLKKDFYLAHNITSLIEKIK